MQTHMCTQQESLAKVHQYIYWPKSINIYIGDDMHVSHMCQADTYMQ